MVTGHIYKPAKTAMQSGRAKAGKWMLVYPRSSRVSAEPLMGWQSSSDTHRQVKLSFPTKQAAIDYCEAHQISYRISQPQSRRIRPRAYADNFAYDRWGSWTH